MMQVAITDANIFIDLYELGLLESFFHLPFDIHTTTFILEELDTECSLLIQKHSSVLYISSEEKVEIENIAWASGFSFPDKSILYLAKRDNMMVFTGEKKMTSWCQNHGLRSHGILFVLEQFIIANILTPSATADKLTALMTINQWLPVEICLELIERWSD